MKSIFQSILLLLLCTSASMAFAQDADDIIKDYLKAVGGADKMAAITTMKMVGETTSPQGTAPMTIIKKAPQKSKMVINVMGSEMIFAYDGATAWSSNPWEGGGAPKKIEGPQAERFTKEEMEDPFLNYAAKGHTVKFLGEEDVNDETHYKVRLTKKGGDEMVYYFNSDNGLPTQMKMLITEGQAKGSIAVTMFSEYKKVGDLMMAHSIETLVDGTSQSNFVVSEMKINEDIPDSEFTFPEEKE